MRGGRGLKRFLIVAVLAGALQVVVPAGPAHAISESEMEFVHLINAERARRGLGRLAVAEDLVRVARAQAERMAARGDIFHNLNLVNDVQDWLVVGENVGRNTEGRSLIELHEAFMDSPTHRENILWHEYNTVGIGITVRGGFLFVAQIFAERSTRVAVSSPRPRRSSPPASPVAAAPKRELEQVRSVEMVLRIVGLDASFASPTRRRMRASASTGMRSAAASVT